MPLAPNQQLFDCTIVRPLGQGPVGHVYLASKGGPDRLVAIRELVVTPQTDAAGFKRFMGLANAAAEVKHPNLVATHSVKIVKSRVYLVLDYLAGGTLRLLLGERGSLPIEMAVRTAGEVCAGLAAAHARQAIHGDIKPENVFFGEDGAARLGGFGLIYAWQALAGAASPGPPLPPVALLYLAPEQLRGQPASPSSDVYQVGLLLYEMLRGQHFIHLAELGRRARETGGSDPAAVQAHLTTLLAETLLSCEPEDVRRVRPGVPDWLGELVMAALARPSDRRPSLDRLVKALQRSALAPARPPVDLPLAEQHFNRGLLYWQQDRADQATTQFQLALRIHPRYPEAHYYLGLAAWQAGRLEAAITELQVAVDLNPAYGEAWRNLGLACWQGGQFARAATAFETVLRLNPDDAEVQGYLETVNEQQRQVDEAVAGLQIQLRLNPNDSAAYYQMGLVYSQHHRLEEAETAFQTALRLRPDFIEAQLSLGVAYQKSGRLDEAVAAFQAALRLDPDRAETHNNLGVTYRQGGRLDEAITAYQAALSLNPDFVDAHHNLGLALWQSGQHLEAVAEYKAILAGQPDDLDARNYLGLVYTQLGRVPEATAEFRAVLRLNPNNAPAHHHLGSIYMLENRWAEAIQEFQLALMLNPGYPEAEYNLHLAYDRQANPGRR